MIGGQYMLQGVSEEKESRILESMLCTVTPEELVLGKLIGLGGAGLTLVGSWITMGALLSGPALLAVKLPITPAIVVLMLSYFLLGYLFYGSLMTGIGAVTNNMREAQQFSFMFTFMNFIPFYLMTSSSDTRIPVAIGLDVPAHRAGGMMLRPRAPSRYPLADRARWRCSPAGVACAAVSARLFRIGS